MEFRLAYHRFGPDEAYPERQRNYYFGLPVKRRGERRASVGHGRMHTDTFRRDCLRH